MHACHWRLLRFLQSLRILRRPEELLGRKADRRYAEATIGRWPVQRLQEDDHHFQRLLQSGAPRPPPMRTAALPPMNITVPKPIAVVEADGAEDD